MQPAGHLHPVMFFTNKCQSISWECYRKCEQQNIYFCHFILRAVSKIQVLVFYVHTPSCKIKKKRMGYTSETRLKRANRKLEFQQPSSLTSASLISVVTTRCNLNFARNITSNVASCGRQPFNPRRRKEGGCIVGQPFGGYRERKPGELAETNDGK